MQIPKQPKSRQEILRQQQQSTFVGREEQIATFRTNLSISPEHWCFLFNVWGQGGVGKSTLLRQFRKIATEASLITALTTDSEPSIPEVMGRLTDQLEQSGQRLSQFSDRYKLYRQKKQELEADPEAPQGFSAFLGRSVAKAGLGLAKQIPGSGAVTPFLDEEMITTQASEWASYLAKKLGNKDEVRLVQEPVEVLSPLFLQDLSKLAEQANLLLLFDVYERTSDFLDGWLRAILEGRYGDLPVNLIFVIAGREPLDQNHWAEYEAAISRLPLDPFTEEEAKQYLIRKGIDNPQVIDVILRLSGCLPLLVATLASESPNDPTRIGDPSGTAVERFLKWVDDPKRRQVALDAALPRVLNRDIIAVLHGEDSADDLFNWLREMPFVEECSDGWAYHDIARTQMLRHKRLVSPQSWTDLHGRLADYYEKLQTDLNLEQEKQYEDATSRQYVLHTLYHRLCQSPQKHLPVALNQFLAAHKHSRQLAHQQAEVTQQAGQHTGASQLENWGKRLTDSLAPIYMGQDRNKVIISLFTELLEFPELDAQLRVVALDRRGQSYRLLNRNQEALEDFDQVLGLDPTYVHSLAGRGTLYRVLGRYEESLRDLSQAIELRPGHSWAIIRRGQTYLEMQQYTKAFESFNRAIELNPQDAWAIAHKGETYYFLERYEEALQNYNKAVEILESLEGHEWVLMERSRVLRKLDRYEEALRDLNQVIEFNSKICFAFRSRGATHLILKNYILALSDFDCAVRLKPHQDWCFYERALAYQALEQSDAAKTDFNQAIQLAQQKYNEKPKDFQNIFNLALYYLASSNNEQAKRFYRDALSKDAPVPRIREAIQDLEDLLRVFPDHRLAQSVREALLKRIEGAK